MYDSLKKTVIHLCVLVAFAQTTTAAALISSHVLKAPPAYTPKPSNPDDNDHLTLEAVTDMLDSMFNNNNKKKNIQRCNSQFFL